MVDRGRVATLQADFGVTRADVSLAYTAVMLGAVVGGPVMGWLSDRFGITVPVAIGTAMLALGLALASQAATMWQFTLVHGLLIGGGTSASFGPVIADISLWFAKRRGVAVAICSSGSYLAGTVWPLVIQPLAQWVGCGTPISASPSSASARCCRCSWRCGVASRDSSALGGWVRTARQVRWRPQRAAIVVDAGGRGLQHCDGDAASTHRCLLHRSWLRLIRRDGVAILDVRATIESHDGALIYVPLTGVCDVGPDGYENFLNGTLPQKATIRAVPRFQTSHPSYLWINRLQCLNVGDVDLATGLVRYDVYAT